MSAVSQGPKNGSNASAQSQQASDRLSEQGVVLVIGMPLFGIAVFKLMSRLQVGVDIHSGHTRPRGVHCGDPGPASIFE